MRIAGFLSARVWVAAVFLALIPQNAGAKSTCPVSGGDLESRIKHHEGVRSCTYRDTLGNYTIGVGHLLKRPVVRNMCWQDRKVAAVFQNDLARAIDNARHDFGDRFDALPRPVQEVLIELSFQVGGYGLLKFRRMLADIHRGEYAAAADELLDSRLARQTPSRTNEQACRLRGVK